MVGDSLDIGRYGALAALFLVIAASGVVGWIAQRAVARGSFMKGYFLGNRGLGAWALALTATVQSGGTFVGYPSLVYSYGWIVLVWIGSYMVVPITGFAILGKRVAQLSRRTGALTVPDLLRERFASPAVGIAASLLILLFIMFTMVAQFKAGAIVMKTAWPGGEPLAVAEKVARGDGSMDSLYYVGLAVFALTVVSYTLFGGFLASVWTDLLQSVLMVVGVVVLFVLTMDHVGGLEQASRKAMANTSAAYLSGPGYSPDERRFLPVELAASMFVLWIYAGVGQPAGIVRLMATKDTATLRRSIVLLSVYNMFIYIPLAAICIAGRAIMPELAEAGLSDEVVPRMALFCSQEQWGGPFVAGIILAAPFGAVMATVSTFLVVVASGLVRDVYLRLIHPTADERTIRRVTYGVMIGVGAAAVLANLRPVDYLQTLIVFSSSGTGSSFLVPALMACYWRRATAPGALAAMFAGAGMVLSLLVVGSLSADPMIGEKTALRLYYMFGMHPFVWGVTASAVAGVVVSLVTKAPDPAIVSKLFDAQPVAATTLTVPQHLPPCNAS